MKRPKFKIWKSSNDGQWYWTLVAANGEPIATSEGYRQRGGALKGMKAVRWAAPFAKVEHP